MTSIKFAASAIGMAGALATAAYAAGERPHAGQPNAPAEQHRMMGMHGMMAMMGHMDPAQMKNMMDDCSKMMGVTAPSNAPSAPQQPSR